jgi:cell division protease FtsH
MNATLRTLIFWIVILFSAIVLWQVVKTNNSAKAAPEISYSQFLSEVRAGDVTRVKISRSHADGFYRDGRSFQVIVPNSQEQMLGTLEAKGVEIWYTESENGNPWAWFGNLLPLVFLAALWYYMIRQLRARTRALGTTANASNDPPASIG